MSITGYSKAGADAAITAAVNAAVNALLNGAPGALDTLKELADAINDDASFAATVTTALGNRLRFDAAQTLTGGQQTQGQANLGIPGLLSSATPLKSAGTGAAGSSGTVARSDHQHGSPVSWGAEQQGFLAWSGDFYSLGGATTAKASGASTVVRLFTPVAITTSNIWLNLTSLGTGLTGAYGAIYQGGTKLAQSTDQSAAWTAIGANSLPVVATVAAGYFEAYFWNTATGSCPLFTRGASLALVNLKQAANAYRFATSDTGLTATAPTTRASLVKSVEAVWVGVD